MSQEKRQKLALAICDYLTKSIKDGTISSDDAEGIEVAVQCIGEAFKVDSSNAEQVERLSIKPADLSSIFDIFLKTQGGKASAAASSGSESSSRAAGAVDPKAADQLKALGNELMANGDYDGAIAKYTAAIELNGTNAVYYSNRAAAYSQVSQHDKAYDDAAKALEIDPNYSKGYSRMGHALFSQRKYKEAADVYRKGLALEPNNAVLKQSLAAAEDMVNESSAVAAGDKSAGGAGGAAGAGGMPDMGGLGAMFSNPDFMKMASSMMNNPQLASMMNNPAISQMAQSLMSDPSALAGLMNNPQMADMAKNLGAAKGGAGKKGRR